SGDGGGQLGAVSVQTLPVDTDGAKLPAPAPAPTPVVPPRPGGYVPPAPLHPALPPTGGAPKTIPTRQLRLPTPGGSAAPGGVSPGGVTLPGLKPGPAQPPVLQ